jgi:hypothetical protein
VNIAAHRGVALASGQAGNRDRGDHGSKRNQPVALMHFEHVGPAVEPRLILGIPLGLVWSDAQIP